MSHNHNPHRVIVTTSTRVTHLKSTRQFSCHWAIGIKWTYHMISSPQLCKRLDQAEAWCADVLKSKAPFASNSTDQDQGHSTTWKIVVERGGHIGGSSRTCKPLQTPDNKTARLSLIRRNKSQCVKFGASKNLHSSSNHKWVICWKWSKLTEGNNLFALYSTGNRLWV